MTDEAEVDRLYDCEVIDEHGERIGAVKQVWLDDRDGRPMWASVHTGLFGLKVSFVPLRNAVMGSGTITVPVAKRQVKGAPRIDVSDQHVSEEQQDELYEYYGLIPISRGGEHDRLPGRGRADTAPMPAAGRTGGGARDDSVTRYEEDLDVGTRDAEADRVRLVKHTAAGQRQVRGEVREDRVGPERDDRARRRDS